MPGGIQQLPIAVLAGMTLVFALACGGSKSGGVIGTGGMPGGAGTGGIAPGVTGTGGGRDIGEGGSSFPGTGGSAATTASGGSSAGSDGGSGGSTSGDGSVGGGNEEGQTCAQIVSDYATAELAARKCTVGAANQCAIKAAEGLGPCGGCREYVNDATTLSAITARWTARGCSNQGSACAIACGALAASTCVDGVCSTGR